jgi:hypothetical protein
VENSGSGQFPFSEVGFPKGDSPEEFLRNMVTFLEEGAAKVAKPAPWPALSPAELRELAAFQEAVLIEQRVRQGDRTISALADTLRKDVWDRLRAGQGLAAISGTPIESMVRPVSPARAERSSSSHRQAAAALLKGGQIVEIRICNDTLGYEAAASLLAVLAHPQDDVARERFKDAYCQHAIRGLAQNPAWANSRQLLRPQCLLEAENRADTAYRRGMKAINEGRLIAACMIAPTLQAAADIAASKPLGNYPARTNREFLCEIYAQLKKHTHDNAELNESNFVHRRWSPSRPVLHLAVAIAGTSTEYRPIDEADPHSRFDRSELIEALAIRAERVRQVVAGAAGIDPDSMIRVRVKRC